MVYALRLMLMDAGLSQLEANDQIIAGVDSLDGVAAHGDNPMRDVP